MKRDMPRYLVILLSVCICFLVGIGAISSAQETEGNNQKQDSRFITIDFDNVDIAVFVKYISELTGKNFIVDNAVKGNVTIISPTKISSEEAYKVFESVLEVNGFTTVPSGSVIKIVPAVEARSKNVETGFHKFPGESADKVVTQLIPLQYANPDELKKVFAPLVSKTSVVISYPPTGMLIVTDVHSNIKRLLRIIREIDVPALSEEVTVMQLQHASAVAVSQSLATIFQETGARSRKAEPARAGVAISDSVIKIIPDERTNALIILANDADLSRVIQLVELLDKEVPRGAGDIQVYYLQHANAEELATVLSTLPTQQAGQAQAGKAPLLSKDVQIVADKATNSLVITAKKADYLVVEDVIKKLDIPRRMVYIEALIMEVNVDKEFRLGIEWQAVNKLAGGSSGAIGGFSGNSDFTNLSGLQAQPPTLPTGFSLGVVGEVINVNGVFFPSLAAMLQAFQNDTDVEIIATPQILTTDNEEAEIKVGENVPYITREEQSSSGLNYSTYEYKDVGVTLKITPQINQEDIVRLKIFQEVIKLAENTVQFRPTTLQRSAETTVIIKDESTVVIGGLIDETLNQGVSKIPILGDIPVLGALFRATSKKRDKTNLFIFLTPHIIRNPAEASVVYEEKKKEAENISEGFKEILNEKYDKKIDPAEEQEVEKKYRDESKIETSNELSYDANLNYQGNSDTQDFQVQAISVMDRQQKAKKWTQKSYEYLMKNDFTTAIKAASIAIDLDSKQVSPYINRAWAYSETGVYDKAIEDCNIALALDSDNALAYNNKGLAYEKSQRPRLALTEYKKACDLGLNEGCANYRAIVEYNSKLLQND